jgi:hypothetical protein
MTGDPVVLTVGPVSFLGIDRLDIVQEEPSMGMGGNSGGRLEKKGGPVQHTPFGHICHNEPNRINKSNYF